MKILTPITLSSDIDILDPNRYNTEFFCGYLPEWWINEFNTIRQTGNLATIINNRNGKNSNVLDFEELKKIVKKACEYNTDVFLVLNAKYYPEYFYEKISVYLDEIASAGIKKLIVSDIGMIRYLEENYPEIKVAVSCLNQATNINAVKFYTKFSNVERIVLPRHMNSAEVANIVKNNPNMMFEFFIFSNKCLYDDGYCRGIHEFTPICKDIFFSEYYSKNGVLLTEQQTDKLKRNEIVFNNWTRSESQFEKKGYCTASFGCSACALLSLKDYPNIVSVKISIRGHDISERLRQVEMANEVLKHVKNGKERDSIKRIICNLYGKEDLCKKGNSCIMI